MYSIISQILLLYKTWRYYNNFDSTISLGIRYRCVKIPQCGYIEHGLKDIAFNVQKHITLCTVVVTSLLVRDKPLKAPASVKRVYWNNLRRLYRSYNWVMASRARANSLLGFVRTRDTLVTIRGFSRIWRHPWRLTFQHSPRFWH